MPKRAGFRVWGEVLRAAVSGHARTEVLTKDPPQEYGLDILDLSVLAYASSFFDEADVRPGSCALHRSNVRVL